jgi:hypothetical protein
LEAVIEDEKRSSQPANSDEPAKETAQSDVVETERKNETSDSQRADISNFLKESLSSRVRRTITWADKHDGVITAFATVAIALLTNSLAADSRRQAETANGQLKIMQRQLDEMRDEQRAWIGPITGVIERPILGGGIKTTVSLANFGKSITHYSGSSAYHIFSAVEWNNGSAEIAIKNYEKACQEVENIGSVIDILFPTNGNNSKFMLSDSTRDGNVSKYIADDALISGKSIFTQMGCLIYASGDKIRHTSFCYFYDSKTFTPPGMNICDFGNHAD